MSRFRCRVSVRRVFDSRFIVSFSIVVICLALAACARAADAVSYYEKTLAEKNIDATADGLNKYLHGLHPNDESRQRATQLIEQLGTTDSFAAREDAMAQLLVMPVLPTEALIAASQGRDPEIRWRAKKILEIGKPESERVLYSAFKTIEEKKLEGVTDELLRAILLCDKPHLMFAAREALKAGARPADAQRLREAIESENNDVRIAAIGALGKAIGKDAADDLRSLYDDSDDQAKLAAARAAVDNGNRTSLNVFVRLLSAEDGAVRASAAAALRELSGKFLEYTAYDPPDKRKAGIAKWQTWVDGEGQTAKLNVPLHSFGGGVSYLGGNTLLAFGYNNKVAEYDPSDNEVWSFTGAQGAWSAEKMANGNVLIAAYSQSRVIEVDRDGNIVWEYGVTFPLNVKPLDNGNVLIASYSGSQVMEVDRDKNVVWQKPTSGNCVDAHRLPSGNTLFAANGRGVFEITPDGETVWEYPDASQCYGCQPLPSGNVLIADLNGRVIEVTRDKNIVWEFNETSAVDAFRLPSGNTLITGANRFIEVTPDKNIVWTKSGCSYGTARR